MGPPSDAASPSRNTHVVFIGHLLVVDAALKPHRAEGSTFELVALREGQLRVASEGDAVGQAGDRVLLPPHSALRIARADGAGLRMYVEPHSFDGRALASEVGRRPNALTAIDVARRLVDPACFCAVERGDYVTAAARLLTGVEPPAAAKRNPAVSHVLAELQRSRTKPTAEKLRPDRRISAVRLRSQFFQCVGMTIGTYYRWLRLRRLCEGLRAHEIAEAAVAAGFKSQNELHDELWRLFGISPQEAAAARWLAR